MAFNQKEWEAKLEKAQTQDEFSALINELPVRPWHEISKERREFSLGKMR